MAIGWRYTPIIVNKKYTKEYHVKMFEYIASKLDGYTSLVAFGFVDLYPKLMKNHPDIKDCDDMTKIEISKALIKIAKNHHMDLRLCSKEKWLKEYGVDIEGCMRVNDYENSINAKLDIKQKMEARKNYCACYLSNDIGSYNSGFHVCQYCYANGNESTVRNNYKNHDDNSPLLIGHLNKEDKVRNAKQESYKKEILLF